MPISLLNYKVLYNNVIYRALSLEHIEFKDQDIARNVITKKPKIIEILVIDSNNQLIAINDEAWKFQFIPITKEDSKCSAE